MGETRLVLSCEHGGHRIPAAYRSLFRGLGRVLASHRGWDPGALEVARQLSRRLGAPLVAATTSRLVTDLNRSRHHPRVLSRYTRKLDPEERARLLQRHYEPYRRAVEDSIRALTWQGIRVLHLSVHSFTPVMNGVRRTTDLGILYDPGRPAELRLARRWQRLLQERLPGLRVRRNSPYRGTMDGLTVALRRRYPAGLYLGLEIEMNQRFFRGRAPFRDRLAGAIEESLGRLLAGGG